MLLVRVAVAAGCVVYAQLNVLAQNMGSVAAERAARANERASAEIRQAWEKATKLSASPVTPKEPGHRSADLADIRDGWVGHIEATVLEVADIVGPTDVMLTFDGTRLWLTGYPTDQLVTRQKVVLCGLLRGGSPRTYDTAIGGTLTVRTIQLLTEEESKQAIAEQAEAKAKEERLKQVRVFTDATGKHTFSGIFIDSKQGFAELEQVDSGKRIKVKLLNLSKADLAWIKETLAAREVAEKQAKHMERQEKLRASRAKQQERLQGKR